MNKLLWYLVIIAIIDTLHDWVMWPWEHLSSAIKKMFKRWYKNFSFLRCYSFRTKYHW